MKRAAVAAILLGASLVAQPASAMVTCEQVFVYDGWEVDAEGLEPYGLYYLYVRDGGGGWTAYKLNVANGGGRIRFLLDGAPFDGYQIRDESGKLVAHC